MTNSQAKALTAKLMAAFPLPKFDSLTYEVYREALETFPAYEQALEVVTDLIRTETYRPQVAAIVDTYNRYDERRRERILQLERPEPTPEEKEENLRIAKEWLGRAEKVAESMEMP